MQTALYIVWGALPLFFFGMALWGKLEQLSGRRHQENYIDLFFQGIFVLVCVFVAVLIDKFILHDIVSAYPLSELPFGVYQVILLPLILYVGALCLGPTKNKKLSTKSAASHRK